MKRKVDLELGKINTVLFFFMSALCSAQPHIKGPKCIIPGTTYQYTIGGKLGGSPSAQICITGGKMIGQPDCINVNKLPVTMLIAWSDSTSVRKIDVILSWETESLAVSGTAELAGGKIEKSDQQQEFDSSQTTYLFRCKKASGGSCQPNYLYQWQRSVNQINWSDIADATTKDLQFIGAIGQDTFFRRVTFETQSNIVAYSDAALLSVLYGNARGQKRNN